jgi:hypothetical protein
MGAQGRQGRLGKRFAIVIGVAAAGVMALGAQTTTAAPDVVKYGTEVTIAVDRGHLYHGEVHSEVRKCMEGRRVILFKVGPGADRKLRTAPRTQLEGGPEDSTPRAPWGVLVHFPSELQHGDVYAKVQREVGDGFVCRADRSETLTRPGETDRSEPLGVSGLGVPAALGAQTATSTTTGPVDRVPPDLRLSGAKTQHVDPPRIICDRWACDVTVKVSCGDEECMARARGRLTKVKSDKLEADAWRYPSIGHPDRPVQLGPQMRKPSQRKQVRKALAEGKNVKAKVTVRAKDAAGNVATAKRTIKIVK